MDLDISNWSGVLFVEMRSKFERNEVLVGRNVMHLGICQY